MFRCKLHHRLYHKLYKLYKKPYNMIAMEYDILLTLIGALVWTVVVTGMMVVVGMVVPTI